MYISVGNNDSFRVVREVVEIVELLYLIGLIFEVEEVAVCFLDGKDGDFLNCT